MKYFATLPFITNEVSNKAMLALSLIHISQCRNNCGNVSEGTAEIDRAARLGPSFEKAEAEKFLPFPPSAFCDFLFLFIVHAVVRSLFGDVDIMRMGLF